MCMKREERVCDFEPLKQHVETLHHLVQAAQSVDEMSQTITDLLSEQRVRETSVLAGYWLEIQNHLTWSTN